MQIDPSSANEHPSRLLKADFTPGWTIRVLGTVAVDGFGQSYDQFPTRRAALILIRLALAEGRSVGRDALAAALWPDEFAEATKPRLRQELARLRRALGDAEEVLEADRLSVKINFGRARVDLQSAERWILRSELEPDPTQKMRLLEPLVDYAEELAPGFEEPWIAGAREKWRSRCSENLLRLAEAYEVLGDPEKAIGTGRKAALAHLLSESVQSRHLQMLGRLDRNEEASSHLAELDRLYPQVLGAGPTRRLAHLLKPSVTADPKPALGTALRPKPRPLPAPLSAMFGREEDLERLCNSLRPARADGQPSPRLVTLCGPGGIGKTQLSLAAGRALTPDFKDRVWFVGLSGLTNPSRLGPTLLEALGIGSIEKDSIEVAGAALEDEPALLILDNFEQLVDGGAQFVRRLLERCPQLELLVTTRRKLNVEGEHEHPVGPLPIASGVDLFLAIARSIRPSLTIDDRERLRVADIVRLMDQMPLAIHLAASRVGVMSISDIEGQLGRRFELLVSRRGDLELRHRTMRQTVAWSYEQLSPELQRFFVDLSIFHGGWTGSMAADVLQEPGALSLLEELRENSFVIDAPNEGEMRFDMLVTLREFATEKQDAKRAEAHMKRLCHALIQLAIEASKHLLSPDQASWFHRLEQEHDNIRSILKWASQTDYPPGLELCSRLWRFWCVRSHHREARAWFERFLPADIAPSVISAQAMFGAARCATEQGDTSGAERWYLRSREAWEALGDEHFVVMTEINRGGVFAARGEHEQARSLFAKGLEATVRDGHTYLEAICRDDLAGTLMEIGDLEDAERQLDAALSILNDQADRIAIAYCGINQGRLRLLQGRLSEAKPFFQRGFDTHREFDNLHGVGAALEWLARTALAEGDLDRAGSLIEDSTQARNQIGDSLGMAHLHRLGAELARRRGQESEARSHDAEAVRLFRSCGCERLA